MFSTMLFLVSLWISVGFGSSNRVQHSAHTDLQVDNRLLNVSPWCTETTLPGRDCFA